MFRSRFSTKTQRWTATGRAISGAVKRPLRPRFVGKYRPGAVHVRGVATAPGPLRTTTTTTTTTNSSSKMRVEVRPGRRARDFFHCSAEGHDFVRNESRSLGFYLGKFRKCFRFWNLKAVFFFLFSSIALDLSCPVKDSLKQCKALSRTERLHIFLGRSGDGFAERAVGGCLPWPGTGGGDGRKGGRGCCAGSFETAARPCSAPAGADGRRRRGPLYLRDKSGDARMRLRCACPCCASPTHVYVFLFHSHASAPKSTAPKK